MVIWELFLVNHGCVRGRTASFSCFYIDNCTSLFSAMLEVIWEPYLVHHGYVRGRTASFSCFYIDSSTSLFSAMLEDMQRISYFPFSSCIFLCHSRVLVCWHIYLHAARSGEILPGVCIAIVCWAIYNTSKAGTEPIFLAIPMENYAKSLNLFLWFLLILSSPLYVIDGILWHVMVVS